MRHWRWYSKVLFALLAAAFAYWVWPTPWQHFTRGELPIRTHRVTGRTEILVLGGWRVWEAPRPLDPFDATPRSRAVE